MSLQSAQFAWHDYVLQVHQASPQVWQNVGQLPSFKPEVFALALRAFPHILDDVRVDEAMLAERFESGAGMQGGREYIADSLIAQLRAEIKHQLLTDLQDLCEQIDANAATVECERMNMTDGQFAEHIRGTEHIL